MKLNFKDTFNRELPADPIKDNHRRQVKEACYSYVTPRVPSKPVLIHRSDEMMESIGLSNDDAKSEAFKNAFSGASVIKGTDPYAMCYGGHQFGHWAGQLGDGRAINLGEVVHENQRWALQLKGAGATPYSRTADGLAVLRSSVREHLCSEAMYHLGVPTTRSLSLMLTGDEVLRDMLYDGNADYEKGAVVCRVSPSFIRFGNFQILASRKDKENLKKLTNYTIKHFFTEIEEGADDKYIQFFKEVANRTMDMVIHWQRAGFVHGVMNTDNMSILGLTIDYGPYGWLEGFDDNWTPNTTDSNHRRYRFGNQPNMAMWNLYQLANALILLVDDPEPFQQILDNFRDSYPAKYVEMMTAKLGLEKVEKGDNELIQELNSVLQSTETDMTIFFRNLSNFNQDTNLNEGNDFLLSVQDSFYKQDELIGNVLENWRSWFKKYKERLSINEYTKQQRVEKMKLINPKYVLRNYMAQMAIDKADKGDYALIDELYSLLKSPYEEQPEFENWFVKRPEWARHKVGCSMLSCSS